MGKNLISFNILTLFLFAILILLLTASTQAQQLTDEEIEFIKRLREQGIDLENGITEKSGGREFSQNSQSQIGFVREIKQEGKESFFKTKNTLIKSTEGITIRTPNTDTFVGFKEEINFPSQGITNYINIFERPGASSIKDIDISGNKFEVKHSLSNPPEFILDNEGRLAEGTKFITTNSNYNLNGYPLNLPENTQIEYLNDRVLIKVQKDSLIIPEIVDETKIRGRIEI